MLKTVSRIMALIAVICCWHMLLTQPVLAQEPCDPESEENPCEDPNLDTYPPTVAIIPNAGTYAAGKPLAVRVEWCDDRTLLSGSRRIRMNGADVTSSFSYVGSTRSGCQVFNFSEGTVTVASGANSLVAEICDYAGNCGSAIAPYTGADKIPAVVSAQPHNGHNRDVTACVESCFDVAAAHTTPSYTSMDQPRAVTLLYRSSTVKPRATVQVDATDASATKPDRLSIRLKRPDGSWVNFTNGTPEIFFRYDVAGSTSRLAAQFDASALSTGAYPHTAVIRSWWGSTVKESSVTVRVLVVNDISSPYGSGWSIAGLQRLHTVSGGVVITDARGSATFFEGAVCTGFVCTSTYVTPRGDFSQLTYHRTMIAPGVYSQEYRRRYPDGILVRFSANGYAKSVEDRYGNKTTYVYDGSNRLSSITDPVGKVTQLGYGANGKLAWIRDPGGRQTTFTINASGDVTDITDPDLRSAFGGTYDSNHRLWSVRGRRGGYATHTYDFAGKLAATTLPQINVRGTPTSPRLEYQSLERTTLVDPLTGQGTQNNPAAQVLASAARARTTNQRGGTSSFQLNEFGAATVTQDPIGRVATAEYNTDGQLLRATNSSGHQFEQAWVGPNRTRTTDPAKGKTVHAEYETTFNQIKHVYGDTKEHWYTWVGGKLESTRTGTPTSPLIKYTYDSRGRRLTAGEGGTATQYAHESSGYFNTASVTSAGRRTSFTYDAHGRVSTTTNPLGMVTKKLYDDLNRVVMHIQQVSSTAYDTTRYTYDAVDVIRVRDPNGQEYGFVYNALGWLETKTDPRGASDQYSYDVDGTKVTWINRRGQTINYVYDVVGRVRSVVADGQTQTFDYAANGGFNSITTPHSTDTVKYDVAGRPVAQITVRGGVRYEIASTYNRFDDRTATIAVAPWSATTTFEYTARRLTKITDVANGVTTISYDNTELPLEIVLPNGLVVERAYPATGGIGSIIYGSAAINGAIGARYAYDQLDRVVERLAPDQQSGREFKYDAKGQLTQVRDFTMVPGGECTPYYAGNTDEPSNPGEEPIGYTCPPDARSYPATPYSYSYDRVGNPTAPGAVVESGNRLTALHGYSMEYDADGNMTRFWKAGVIDQTLQWNSLSQLESVTTNGTVVHFAYDAFGRRVRKSTGGIVTQYIYDGANLFAEVDASGSRLAEYAYYPGVDRPHSVRRGSSIYYFATDNPGNVVGLIDQSGSLVNQYAYSPFGVREHAAGSVANTLGFGARENDPETGLYYNRARYYNPVLGRFISEDPLGLEGGINPYVYASNNPIKFVDPFGLTEEELAALCPEGWELVDYRQEEDGTEHGRCERGGGGDADDDVTGFPSGLEGAAPGVYIGTWKIKVAGIPLFGARHAAIAVVDITGYVTIYELTGWLGSWRNNLRISLDNTVAYPGGYRWTRVGGIDAILPYTLAAIRVGQAYNGTIYWPGDSNRFVRDVVKHAGYIMTGSTRYTLGESEMESIGCTPGWNSAACFQWSWP